VKKYIREFLERENIVYELHQHNAVSSENEAETVYTDPTITVSKNLFLKNKKGDKYYLVILPLKKRLDMRKLEVALKEKKVRFCNDVEVRDLLGLEPGSVSILGLLNDKNNKVKLYIDKELWLANKVSCHPNENTMSLVVSGTEYQKIANIVKNDFLVLKL
jgi:Ala-tRNA(Pro) deacylase